MGVSVSQKTDAQGGAHDPSHLLSLGRITRSDCDDLIRANRQNVQRHRPWFQPPTDELAFITWFQGGVSGAHVNLIAHELASRRIVGVVSLENIACGSMWSAQLSYYGMGGFEGRGYMTAAVRLGLRHGFGHLGLHRVEAAVQPQNERSRALLQRLGFRLEGFSPEYIAVDGDWRDHERWALLRREFR